MKSLTTSTALHAVLLTWGLWSLSSPEKLEMGGEAVPVTLVADVSQSMIGDEKAPQTDTPAPQPTKTPAKLPMPAEHVGDNEVDLPTPPAPKAAPRESVKTAAAEEPPPPPPAPTPPPKPAPEPKPAPTPAPKPPEPTPEPDEPDEPEETEADSTPEIDPLAAEIAKAEAEKPPTPPAPPKHVPAPQAKPKPPEPVKVAEAKPEPVKEKPPTPEKAPEKAKTPDKSQSTEKSAEKAKEPKKPATQTSKEKSFDADAISALLNKQDSAGGGAKRSTQQASLGGKTQTGGTLSQSEMDALRGQISKCWNPPAGNADAGSFRVKISMQLDPSGQLQGLPTLESGGGSSVAERAAGEAAIRAVRRCAPYNLPAEKYDSWAEVTVNFDPSQMF